MLKHLPPAAFPATLSDISSGLQSRQSASAHFSEALQVYLNSGPCYLASSGRTALFILLQSLHKEGEAHKTEVILPAYTCPALVKVILDSRLQPVLVDISAQTLTFDLEQLNHKLSRNTLAVIGVHPFGIPQDFEEIKTLAHGVDAVLIEDAAQSMGARLNNRFTGTQGDFGLFSLGPGKALSTGGGGILSVNNAQYEPLIAKIWQALKQPGLNGDALAIIRYSAFSMAFHPLGWGLATRLKLNKVGNHESSWGYSLSKLTGMQAGLGLALLPNLEDINQQRQRNAQCLIDGLKGLPYLHIPPIPQGGTAIYTRLPILAQDKNRRENLYQALWKKGIGVGKMYEQILGQIFPQLGTESYPGAERVANQLLTLPTHHYLGQDNIKRIIKIARYLDGSATHNRG